MENIKDRLLAFSDGIIAIIITIMVLDLPEIKHNDWSNARLVALSVAIYFISFIFVANSWYKHAIIFGQVDKLDTNSISYNFIYLMVLSLMPYATKLMTSDLNEYTILFYGLLYLLTSLIYRLLARHILHQKYEDKESMRKIYDKIYTYNDAAFITESIAAIILGFFFPIPSLVIFLGIPIVEFLHRQADNSDLSGLENISTADKQEVSQLTMAQWRDFRKEWRDAQKNLNLRHHKRGKLTPEEIEKLQQASDNLLKKYNFSTNHETPVYISRDNKKLVAQMNKSQWHDFANEWQQVQKHLGIENNRTRDLMPDEIETLKNAYSQLLQKYMPEIKKDA